MNFFPFERKFGFAYGQRQEVEKQRGRMENTRQNTLPPKNKQNVQKTTTGTIRPKNSRKARKKQNNQSVNQTRYRKGEEACPRRASKDASTRCSGCQGGDRWDGLGPMSLMPEGGEATKKRRKLTQSPRCCRSDVNGTV